MDICRNHAANSPPAGDGFVGVPDISAVMWPGFGVPFAVQHGTQGHMDDVCRRFDIYGMTNFTASSESHMCIAGPVE